MKQGKNKFNKLKIITTLSILTALPLTTISCGIINSLNKDFEFLSKKEINNSQTIMYNSKFDKSGGENFNYDPSKLSVIEYPYAKSINGKYLYFFGQEGLKQLVEDFYVKGFFGSEITELNNVYINKPNDNTETTAQGLYIGEFGNIYINTKDLIYDADNVPYKLSIPWEKMDNNSKSELILPTLIHEYLHHISYIYNNSFLENDSLSTGEIVYKEKNKKNIKELNNKKFVNNFKEALRLTPKYSKMKKRISIDQKFNAFPVYEVYSANELFENANYTGHDWSKHEGSNVSFNHNTDSWINFANALKNEELNYFFSFSEMFAREFIKLSYAPDAPIRTHYNNKMGYLGMKNNKEIFLSSYGEDLSKILSIYKHNKIPYELDKYSVMGANWVFEDDEYLWTNNSKKTTHKKQMQLYKAYLDLVGYGLPISLLSTDATEYGKLSLLSTISSNSSEIKKIKKSYNELRFGGFIPTEWVDKNQNKDVYLLIKNNNKEHKLKLNIFHDGIAKTKSVWKAYWNNGLGQDWGPEQLKLGNYYSYITEKPLNIEELNLIQDINFSFWIDENNDNNVDNKELKEFEINALRRYNDAQIRISSYRRKQTPILTKDKSFYLEYVQNPKNSKQMRVKLNQYEKRTKKNQ
ncbi:MYPU_1760 family metalloprotease [Mycoplasma phocoenae]|uniref:Uncharacterized protein n=1 Tax=Mycoplasma phocoenae TaxID=754517 RepID=A0A858U1A3_9MOLU|nr:hypothetical protein [Mycoplasma phocoenae]QJG66894.1 hypothetical protein HGG69_00955 [Mycoplasma phocoenae]